MRLVRCGLWVVLLCLPLGALAQASDGSYSRLNTFTGFVEYSNDSSHMILGISENRKIGALGFQYQRRLVHRRLLDFSYAPEMRPGMLESDPTETVIQVNTAPTASEYPTALGAVVKCTVATSPPVSTVYGGVTYTYYNVNTCGRRLAVEQGFSPAGFRVNLMPRHRLQPTFSVLAGYMFSSQPVPISDAGTFNYTFEFGAGLELYRTGLRSVRLEWDVQHFSNKDTADYNPGVDSGSIKLTYAFGK